MHVFLASASLSKKKTRAEDGLEEEGEMGEELSGLSPIPGEEKYSGNFLLFKLLFSFV